MKTLNIRQRRISNKWTQDYVAQRIGLTRTAVHDIETGKQLPSFKVLLKLLALFGMEKIKEEVEQLFAVAIDETNNLSA